MTQEGHPSLEAENAVLREQLAERDDMIQRLLASNERLQAAVVDAQETATQAVEMLRAHTAEPEAATNETVVADVPTREMETPAERPRRTVAAAAVTEKTETTNKPERGSRVKRALAIGGLVLAATVGSAIALGSGKGENKISGANAAATTPENGNGGTSAGDTDNGSADKAGDTGAAGNDKKPAHTSRYEKAEDAKTVAGTVARLDVHPKTAKADIKYLGSNKHEADKLDHTTSRNAMSSMLKFREFGGGSLGPNEAAVAAADSAFSSEGYGSKFYNIMNHDYNNDALPQGVSLDEARQAIENKMTADGTKFSMEHPKGTFMNHGQHGEDVFNAGIVSLDGSKKVFTITYEDGTKMYFKLFRGEGGRLCMNFLTPVTITHKTPNTPHTPPVERHHETPGTPGTHTHTSNPQPKPHHQPVPGTNTGGGNPQPKPEDHPKPKHDNNTTPAGVPGQNGGTPDKAGKGPAGQQPDASGFVPGEDHPVTPAPKPTPAPLPEQAPATTPPTETNPASPEAPTAPSTSEGQTIPTGDPDPQG